MEAARQDDRLPFSPAVGCALSVLVGIVCAGAFTLVLWFNRAGEVAYAPDPFRGVRVWLVRDEGPSRLGLSLTRELPGGTATRRCALTSVRFIGTTSEADDDVEFCECYSASAEGWSPAGACGE